MHLAKPAMSFPRAREDRVDLAWGTPNSRREPASNQTLGASW